MYQITTPLEPMQRSAEIVAGLATLYYRHNDPARALALGLMAMRCGADTPQVSLLVASCFLKTGDAEQAEAALSRTDTQETTDDETAAIRFLKAKIRLRMGDPLGARDLLAEAAAVAGEETAP